VNAFLTCPSAFSSCPSSLLLSAAAMPFLYQPDLPRATMDFYFLNNPVRSAATLLSSASPGIIRARGPSSAYCAGSAEPPSSPAITTVAQALEVARESPEGAEHPTVSAILEGALVHIWSRIQARPRTYLMTRQEFAVFNYFQHRFQGDEVAVAARRRYWDHARGSDGD
jgi:hypothetical protein